MSQSKIRINETEKKAPLSVTLDNSSDETIDKAYDALLKAGDEGRIPTDEEIENISKILEENSPEDVKLLRKILEESTPEELMEDLREMRDTIQNVTIDPVTGKATQISDYDEDKFTGDFEDLFNGDLDGSEPVTYDKDAVMQVLQKNYGKHNMEVADLERLIAAMDKQRQGEKVKFTDMPPIIQKEIMNTIITEGNGKYVANKEIKDQMTRIFIQGLMEDSLYQEINNVFLDLGQTINNIAKEEATEAYNNSFAEQRKILETVIPETAEKLKDSDPEKADALQGVHSAYKNSYTLEGMLFGYTHTGKCKIKKYDVENIQRWYDDFNRKYENSKWIIRDISMVEPILRRRLDEEKYTINDIKAFLLVFCKYTMNMRPSNITEHTFMYYFIMNIINLDIFDRDNEEDAKFYGNFVDKICNFIDIIKERAKY